ncbi:hypothetical protein GCM10027053_19660 [Intrasporangium mesophilum]
MGEDALERAAALDGTEGGVDMLAQSSHSDRACSTPRREVDKMKPSHVDGRVHDEEDVTT